MTRTNIRTLETGMVKPGYRRVVFKRGTSSVTVRGNVTRALSDTYRVVANAGQTMTVQLNASQKGIQFFALVQSHQTCWPIMHRELDQKLPESGE